MDRAESAGAPLQLVVGSLAHGASHTMSGRRQSSSLTPDHFRRNHPLRENQRRALQMLSSLHVEYLSTTPPRQRESAGEGRTPSYFWMRLLMSWFSLISILIGGFGRSGFEASFGGFWGSGGLVMLISE